MTSRRPNNDGKKGGGERGGRGSYYKNKYGGGRGGGSSGGRGGGRGVLHDREVYNREHVWNPSGGGSFNDLKQLLQRIDGRQYPSYHDIETSTGWKDTATGIVLFVGRAQADPFAPPTRCRIIIPQTLTQLPARFSQSRIERVAVADYMWRQIYKSNFQTGVGIQYSKNGGLGGDKGWNSPKGGDIQIQTPTQHVIEQSAVKIDNGNVVVQLTINLPARGRTILSQAASEILARILPQMLIDSICVPALDIDMLQRHVTCIQDQDWLQNSYLPQHSLVAFIRNDAILPRQSGADDRPLQDANVLPFVSPEERFVSVSLPYSSTTIQGMGIPQGITLICGGGFHGKSTLLQAIQAGVYLKVPGDGREYCVTLPTAVKIRAEDGRCVKSVDISSFIRNLPNNIDTTCFSTADASGSTSQASNIVEAMECGSQVLLIDEDTCATNFMIRDRLMSQLISSDREPIRPFVRVVRSLFYDFGVSTIMVIGGVGDYFEVADIVLVMDEYKCSDATIKAKTIAIENPTRNINEHVKFEVTKPRLLIPTKFIPDGKVKVTSIHSISYGETQIDLHSWEQLVTLAQTRAIANALQQLAKVPTQRELLYSMLSDLNNRIEREGLDVLSIHKYDGDMTRPRILDIAAVVNRLRRNGSIEQA